MNIQLILVIILFVVVAIGFYSLMRLRRRVDELTVPCQHRWVVFDSADIFKPRPLHLGSGFAVSGRIHTLQCSVCGDLKTHEVKVIQ